MLSPALAPLIHDSIRLVLQQLPSQLSILSVHAQQVLARIEDDWFVLIGPDDDDDCAWLDLALPGEWVVEMFENVGRLLVTHFFRRDIPAALPAIPAGRPATA